MWYPNWVWTTSLISPGLSANAACSNSRTMRPFPNQPRSPPLVAAPGSCENRRHRSTKSAPPFAALSSESARTLALATSAGPALRVIRSR